jgi:hypothetical protein
MGLQRHEFAFRRTRKVRRHVAKHACMILAICSLLLLGISACSPDSTAEKTTSGTGISQGATMTPTFAQVATATPLPGQLVLTPSLGGTPDAFDRAFGPPRSTTATGAQYATTLQGVQVYVTTQLSHTNSGDRASSIELQAVAAAPWDAATATKVASTMFPSDALLVSDRQTTAYGEQYIYTSASLAASFPADAFRAVIGTGFVQPGSFFFSCSDSKQTHSSCLLKIGY